MLKELCEVDKLEQKGSGKLTLANAFAMALQCTGEEKPCGTCHSCHQAASGNHPDIIHIRHEKPNSIGVDDVRDQLVGDVQIRPYNGKYKIYERFIFLKALLKENVRQLLIDGRFSAII